MIKISNERSNQSLNKKTQTIVQELQKHLLKMKSELEKKNKQMNQYNKVRKMTFIYLLSVYLKLTIKLHFLHLNMGLAFHEE